MRTRVLILLFLLAINNITFSQLSMVQDIKYSGSSSPCRLTTYNNKLFFLADDGINGNELWSYDGINVTRIPDIFPGAPSSAPTALNRTMADCAYRLYFAADAGTKGYELYSYDGSSAPVFVSDIWGGPNGSHIDEMIALNNKMYFNANNGLDGMELWSYDPANDKALYLTDLNPGAASANPSNITACNDKVFFAAVAPGLGNELYVYDPLTDATILVADIYSGDSSSDPQSLFAFGNNLYFSAKTAAYGRELYLYDGTSVQRLTDFNTGAADGIPAMSIGAHNIFGMWNTIFFAGNDGATGTQLYKYDPVGNTGILTATINPAGDDKISGFINYANKFYFIANDGIHGRELWMYDNINAPTIAADIYQGSTGSDPCDLTVVGKDLFFSATGTTTGTELYKYSDAAASIQNIIVESPLKIYPIPATDVAYIEFSLRTTDLLSLTLTDAAGKNVYNSRAHVRAHAINKITIPMNGLPNGCYYCCIRTSNGNLLYESKLLKQ